MLPFSNINHPRDTAYVPGEDGDNSDVRVNDRTVGSGFFKLLKIDFPAGQPFDSAAVANQLPEAVINAPRAKHFFGGAAMAIGRTIDVGKTYRVVGVTKSISWNPIPSQYPFETAFLPLRAGLREVLIVVLAVQSVTPSFIESARDAIKRAMPQSAVYMIQPLPQTIVGASTFRSVGVGIVGTFAALAVLVAAFGAFAITAFIAWTRLGEYAIRAAIGAGPSALLRLALSAAIWLIAIGMAVGLLCAWLLAHVFTGALYHTHRHLQCRSVPGGCGDRFGSGDRRRLAAGFAGGAHAGEHAHRREGGVSRDAWPGTAQSIVKPSLLQASEPTP